MQRGLMILLLQFLICSVMTGVGLWALFKPKNFQSHINEDYALLPPPRDGFQPSRVFVQASGIFLLWYGLTLFKGFREELLFLARLF